MRPLMKHGRYINSQMGKAIDAYGLIDDGDRILVAVSGGKDSMTLLSLLKERLSWIPVKYELAACHIRTDFHCRSCTHTDTLTKFFKNLGVEYVFKDDRSIVDQRELGRDTLSFARALKSTFRQDPDVIMVGEMRDSETISTAITAAETGHLVLATLHTNSAAQSIHRIVDTFPGTQQGQIRAQLSGSLLGVVSQRLVPRIKGGLIPACEIMMNTPAIANLIRENKVHEMPLVIETSAEIGMISLNRYLANLVRAKEIALDTAQNYSLNPAELRGLVRR